MNTIITSCFGAWMGLYGFLELKLDSYNTLIAITIIAAVIALLMGVISTKLTNAEAQDALYNQKIHNLQG